MPPPAALREFGEDIWLADGKPVRLMGMPFPTRMTVIRLAGDRLWLHSPVAMTPDLRVAVDALGTVSWFVAPNKLHHLFLGEWQKAYPEASAFAAPGLASKRPDLRIDAELGDAAPREWNGEIESLVFRGSRVMREVVCFHRQSRSLIVADLIENFESDSLTTLQRWLARVGGVLAPNGSTPRDFRGTFIGSGREEARASLARLLAWQPRRIVIAHGRCITDDADAFLRRAFAWLDA